MEKEPLSIPKSERIRDAFLLTLSSGAIAFMDTIINKGYSNSDLNIVEGFAVIISLISVVRLLSLYSSSDISNS